MDVTITLTDEEAASVARVAGDPAAWLASQVRSLTAQAVAIDNERAAVAAGLSDDPRKVGLTDAEAKALIAARASAKAGG